jgi:hypothetical protein
MPSGECPVGIAPSSLPVLNAPGIDTPAGRTTAGRMTCPVRTDPVVLVEFGGHRRVAGLKLEPLLPVLERQEDRGKAGRDNETDTQDYAADTDDGCCEGSPPVNRRGDDTGDKDEYDEAYVAEDGESAD